MVEVQLINISPKALLRGLILVTIIFIVSSCSENNNESNKDILLKKDPVVKPVQIQASKGIKTFLDTCPLPSTVIVPSVPTNQKIRLADRKLLNLAPPETEPADFFVIMKNYTTEQGLALDAINCGFQDKSGNLWFGTNGGGVSRYDGKSFTNFTTAQGLANNNIWGIVEDKTGNLWFNTYGDGLSKYDGVSFTNFTTAQGLPNNNVMSMMADKKGNLWLGTYGGGVSKYDPSALLSKGSNPTNFTTAQGLPNNHIRCMIEDKMGNLWFGTSGGGVCKYDGKSFTSLTTKQGLANDDVRNIIEDKSGNLWFGTFGGGVCKYDPLAPLREGSNPINFSTVQGLINNNVRIIIEDKRGNLWFGTFDGGLSKYDPSAPLKAGSNPFNISMTQGLANNIVNSINEDKNGNLWFGTFGGGVNRYDGRFTNVTMTQGLANNIIYGITEDKTGDLWFGTFGKGVRRYNGKSFTSFTTAQGLANNHVRCIAEDKTGNLWFGTNGGGLSKYDGKCFTTFTTKQGLANNDIYSIAEDKKGNLWFSTFGGGVCKYDGKSFTSFSFSTTHNIVWCITEDKTGNLWFGTFGGGVCKYDGKSFTNFTTAQGLASNTVHCVTEDETGNIWFGTNGGLSLIRKNKLSELPNMNWGKDAKLFESFTMASGLSNDVIRNVVEDKSGNIIIGTNEGFTVIKNIKEKTPPSLICEIYNFKTGYPVKDINSGQGGMLIDHNGIIWAGSGDKFFRFDYSGIIKNPKPLNVFIQSVKINNETICWYDLTGNEKKLKDNATASIINEEVTTMGKVLTDAQRDTLRKKFNTIKFDSIARFYPLPQNLVLPYEHNNITFDFAAIEPARPFLVRYQYILEGYDKKWSSITEKTSANFGNIYEGTYTFKLKALSPDGVWSEPILYTFKILPPYFRSWWAYIIYLIVFFVFIYVFYLWRIAALKKEFQTLELEHKLLRSQMNPHFIYNSLNAIQSFIIENNVKESTTYISNFADLMRLILENSRLEYVIIQKELDTLELYLKLQQLRFENEFEYFINVDEKIDKDEMKIPPMLAQPFIENAIEHGMRGKNIFGKLIIRFILKNNFIIFEVEDNGIGRVKAMQLRENRKIHHKSLATQITQERIEILNRQNQGEIKFEIIDLKDKEGNACGTKVTFDIPCELS